MLEFTSTGKLKLSWVPFGVNSNFTVQDSFSLSLTLLQVLFCLVQWALLSPKIKLLSLAKIFISAILLTVFEFVFLIVKIASLLSPANLVPKSLKLSVETKVPASKTCPFNISSKTLLSTLPSL